MKRIGVKTSRLIPGSNLERGMCAFEGRAGQERKLSDQCLFAHALLRHSD